MWPTKDSVRYTLKKKIKFKIKKNIIIKKNTDSSSLANITQQHSNLLKIRSLYHFPQSRFVLSP